MSDFVVETAFRASQDQVSTTLKKQATAATTFGSRVSAAFKNATKQSSIFRSMLGANLMSNAISRMTSMATQGLRSVVSEYADFDDAIGRAVAKMPGAIKRGTEEFDAIAAAARLVGKETMFSATEAAEGLDFLAMAGFNAEQAVAALPGVVSLATATSMDLGRATDIASDALGAFGLMSADTAQLQLNLARINDVFAKTTNTANVDMENMFMSLKQGAPVFTAAGQSVESFAALVGKLGSAGIKGEQAGTMMRAMMVRLQGPTGKAVKSIKDLGLQVENSDGGMRDIVDIIGDYNAATAKMGDVQKAALTAEIFGVEAMAGMQVLLAEGADGLREYRGQLEQASGVTGEMAKNIEQSLGSKLKILKSSLIEVGFKMLDNFAGPGKKALDGLVDKLNNFDTKPIVEGISAFAAALKATFGFVKDNWGTIKLLIGGFVAIKVALGAIGFAKAIAGFAGIFKGATAAAGAAEAAAAATGAAGGVAPAVGAAPAAGAAGGAAGMVAPVAAAAYGGYVLGNIIEENWLNPLREAGQKTEVSLGNLVNKLSMADFGAMDAKELAVQQQKIRSALYQAEPAVYSLETAWEQAGSSLTRGAGSFLEMFGILSAQQSERIDELNKGPIEKQQEQIISLSALYAQLSDAIVNAKAKIDAAAAATTTQIDVNVANAPAGTTVEAKGSKGAPKVNTSQAGKN